jgi:hypothetical protein
MYPPARAALDTAVEGRLNERRLHVDKLAAVVAFLQISMGALDAVSRTGCRAVLLGSLSLHTAHAWLLFGPKARWYEAHRGAAAAAVLIAVRLLTALSIQGCNNPTSQVKGKSGAGARQQAGGGGARPAAGSKLAQRLLACTTPPPPRGPHSRPRRTTASPSHSGCSTKPDCEGPRGAQQGGRGAGKLQTLPLPHQPLLRPASGCWQARAPCLLLSAPPPPPPAPHPPALAACPSYGTSLRCRCPSPRHAPST